ncbi:hypothetical protein BGZ99_006807, partial [Dissophora globulifera]
HAGYSYSGPAAGYAYKCIQPDLFKRVFILGPSHHVYLPGCALSRCVKYLTPLGDLTIDQKVNKELEETGEFEFMSQDTDESEHSIEMHLPYVYKVFEHHLVDRGVTIVPILVGALTESTERKFGKLLAPYFNDPENLFIVSSDFCHWGQRFHYTYYADASGSVTPSLALASGGGSGSSSRKAISPTTPKIFESIETLDREGMATIERQSHADFCKYLARTKNTICGRHPIGVLMAAMEAAAAAAANNNHNNNNNKASTLTRTRFVHYAQSSSVLSTADSSVSYASAFVQRQDPL